MAARYDCLCLGNIVADHVCAPVEKIPGSGELVMTQRLSLSTGGCASNVAVDLARLQRRAAIVGLVGTDPLGRYVKDALAAAGADVTHVHADATTRTSATLVVNVSGEDRRFIHDVGGNAELDGSQVTEELVRASRAVYVGGFSIMPRLTAANVSRIFRLARQSGVPTLLDVVLGGPVTDHHSQELNEVLPWTDIFMPNFDEARLLTGSDSPWEQADLFHAAGASTVVITCGRDGAVLRQGELRLQAAAYTVPFVDGTGSGDAFSAGYIHGLLEGLAPGKCLEYGSALGASCVQASGATTGVFSRDQLEAFVAAYPLRIEQLCR
jgi:sugar/nucleoside kinase (ribokinase family)